MSKKMNALPAVLRIMSKCYFFTQMLTPLHNDANDTDGTDDYDRVIGIAQLAKKGDVAV